jgi:nucleoside-diphosphate-sugar epimerase
VDDVAGAFVVTAESGRGGLWHVTDDQPVASGEYLRNLAQRIGAVEPRRVPRWIARIVAGKMAVDFMTSSTRTSNARFRRDFNWTPRYPSYREALDQIVGEWRRENFLGLGSKIAA